MSTASLWFLIAGGIFVLMALSGTLLKRLPLSTSLVYLAIGFGLGPAGAGLLHLDPLTQAGPLERIAEVAVLISLFASGLKLRAVFGAKRWALPVRLAVVSMAITVGLIALVGVVGLGLGLGAAVLLGAILAPTDPVLASDVQLDHPHDRDHLRFALTGEAGLNDGTAFPFVMLGLGLLGLHDLGAGGWRWLTIDVLWAGIGGLGIGWLLGTVVGRIVLYLRAHHREALGLDDFLTLGLIALAYGAALSLSAYGFLAVFAAGLALRQCEMRATGDRKVDDAKPAAGDAEAAVDQQRAPAILARAVLEFDEQLERIAEVALVVMLGAMLATVDLASAAWWFPPLLLVVIRPLAVLVGLAGARSTPLQRGLTCWFGIRGIGSIYYLMYAVGHGLDPATARQLIDLTLITVATSIVAHGISVTPLMGRYRGLSEA
mgnify:CR=1 FL=1